MTPIEARDFLKKFDQNKLKECKIHKITEFCLPESRTGIITIRSKKKDFFVDFEGRIIEYKTQVNDKITAWQQYEYNEKGDLILVKEFHYNKNRKGKWMCRSTAIDTIKDYGRIAHPLLIQSADKLDCFRLTLWPIQKPFK